MCDTSVTPCAGFEQDEYFRRYFSLLTGRTPFPWQERAFAMLASGHVPSLVSLPTGTGKTSLIPIWLLALARQASSGQLSLPRRLVWVVNRRTVVDQATNEARGILDRLTDAGDSPFKPEEREALSALRACLAGTSLLGMNGEVPVTVSTLRGQLADDGGWSRDPSRPAIIIGTVDMIGSRLLFAGYGRGFKSRPLHAGFLGQDALLVHDEAHLEPAFQELVATVESEQKRCGEFRRFQVMALTATSRSGGEQSLLTHADRSHQVLGKRLEARKGIIFSSAADEAKLPAAITERALEHKASGQAILVFLRKLEYVEKVTAEIRERQLAVQVLTGTMRGLERDALAQEDPIFARFMPRPNPGVNPQSGTVYLVCTSAGEVGIDISADHLVCDLTPFDSMAQRFGRVNRFGDGDARINVVSEEKQDEKKKDDVYEQARWNTLKLLISLPMNAARRHDASPTVLNGLPAAERQAAFTPPPEIPPATDILFDTWALTSLREKLPGRPPVADWLHGVAEWEPSETHVAWREEVGCLTGALIEKYKPEALLEDYPLKQHELLRDRTARVFKHLETMAKRCPDLSAWLVDPEGNVRVLALTELVKKDPKNKPEVNLANCTVLLPPSTGGLINGILDGGAAAEETIRYDITDEWKDERGQPRRRRVWDNDAPPEGMRLVLAIDTQPDADDDQDDGEAMPGRRNWLWYVLPRSADDDGSRTALEPQELEPHLLSAERFASSLVARLGLSDPEALAVTLAARWHDLGKRRVIWQRSIGNRCYPEQVLAKSGGKMRPVDLSGYRHEFGSLLDLAHVPDFQRLTLDVQDLVLHFIAAHHGRARPHFPADEVFDPESTEEGTARIAREAPRRFARLQRKYGRWGLAYLESLVRTADALASQPGEATGVGATAPTSTPTDEAVP
ncbi:MAG: type I-U CRISPR-associated helicase/endonuclease Cas3 [Candidatus Eisenbacteria bacterium]|nr:type I-U CRISPR-associated helicase/endonuclease Cas3 [Candidatus Eisenbacteria bacterium]